MIDDLSTKTEAEVLALIEAANERLEAITLEKKETLYVRVAEIKVLCEALNIPIKSLFSELGTPSPSSAPPVKYRNEKGETWTGKSRRPDWIKTALKGLTPEQQLDRLNSFRV